MAFREHMQVDFLTESLTSTTLNRKMKGNDTSDIAHQGDESSVEARLFLICAHSGTEVR